jgi:hypothetical protein
VSQAALSLWWNGSWPIFAAVFGLAALIAAGLGWKRRRTTPTLAVACVAALPEETARPRRQRRSLQPHRQHRTPIRQPEQAITRYKAADALGRGFGLAHVTEEAAVYLAFNRVDRAIDVCASISAHNPRSLPAA